MAAGIPPAPPQIILLIGHVAEETAHLVDMGAGGFVGGGVAADIAEDGAVLGRAGAGQKLRNRV